MCYPAARVLHTQPGTTLDRQGYLLLCKGGTAAVLRLKSSAPLAQLVTTSICMNLYVLSHISPPTDIQNNKSHVFLPNKVSSLPLALQQDCLYAVWQALPTEKGPAQAYRLLNGMVMLRVSTIKAKWPSSVILSSAVAWHLLLCIRHLDTQENHTEDVNSLLLTTATEASTSDGQLMRSCTSLNPCSPLPLQLLLGRVNLPVSACHLPVISQNACTLFWQWHLNSLNLHCQYLIKMIH